MNTDAPCRTPTDKRRRRRQGTCCTTGCHRSVFNHKRGLCKTHSAKKRREAYSKQACAWSAACKLKVTRRMMCSKHYKVFLKCDGVAELKRRTATALASNARGIRGLEKA